MRTPPLNPVTSDDRRALLEALLEVDGVDQAMLASGVDREKAEALLREDEFILRVETEQAKYKAKGKDLPGKARSIIRAGLDRIAAQVGGVDAFGAAELMKPALKLLEHHERVVASQRSPYDNLPVINVIFGPGMSMKTDVVEAEHRAPMLVEEVAADVLDASTQSAAVTPPSDAAAVLGALAASVQPLQWEDDGSR